MASISYKKTLNFLIGVFKEKFLLLQIPIFIFLSIPFFNSLVLQDSSRNEGHALIAKLRSQEINMVQFQQELAQLSKTSGSTNSMRIPFIGFLCLKFLLYWGAIICTMVIGLAFCNNRPVVIPSMQTLGRSAFIITAYIFFIVLLALPTGFSMKILGTLIKTTSLTPVTILLTLLGLITFGLYLFLMGCFSSTIPLILDTDSDIYSSIRKSYRMNKGQSLKIIGLFFVTLTTASMCINIVSILLYKLLPHILHVAIYKYAGGLLTTTGFLLFVAFYNQLTTQDSPSVNTINIPPPHGA